MPLGGKKTPCIICVADDSVFHRLFPRLLVVNAFSLQLQTNKQLVWAPSARKADVSKSQTISSGAMKLQGKWTRVCCSSETPVGEAAVSLENQHGAGERIRASYNCLQGPFISSLHPLKVKRKLKTTAHASWKVKRSVFFLHLKANWTKCFGSRFHKTLDKPNLTNKWCRKTPDASVQTVSASASLSVHARGDNGASNHSGFTTTFNQTVPNTEHTRARGGNRCSQCTFPALHLKAHTHRVL